MNLLKTLTAAVALSTLALAQSQTQPPLEFAGRYLLALSDTDMLPTAYVDDQLGAPIAAKDTLSILSLRGTTATPTSPSVLGQVNVSNAVTAWPFSMIASKNGRTLYVIETSAPRPEGVTTLSRLPLGTQIRSLDISNPAQPKVVNTLTIGRQPGAVDLNPAGDLLAVSQNAEPGQEILLIPVKGTTFGTPAPYEFRERAAPEDAITGLRWHPSGNFLAAALTARNEIRFYRVDRSGAQPTLLPWGNPVVVGPNPVGGYFTPNGRHFITNSVHGFTAGSLSSIRFATEGDNPTHSKVAQVDLPPAPEGMAMSPNGTMVAVPNMDVFPRNRPSVSLVRVNPSTGALTVLEREFFLEGFFLPQGITFDARGQNLAVTSFIQSERPEAGGLIRFLRIRDGRLESTGLTLEVPRGPHQLLLIR